MLFSSSVFIFLFLPVVTAIYYILLRKTTSRNIFLLLASLLFYAWGEPKFVFIMLLSIIANYIFGILIDKYRQNSFLSRLIIILTLIFNLSLIFIFKYLTFTINSINNLFNKSIFCPEILLPIGISFFTFQAISYVIDIYRNDGKVQYNPLNVGLYISFFPQLIAGPIVRYQTISEQVSERHEALEEFCEGVCRFIVGLSKKVLLANNFSILADRAFDGNLCTISIAMAWIGAISYTFQIYFDFSGYSDMAIGLGRMFGFKFNENFNHPYISKSVSEFWRRWHISLGTWFRDYVYIPLGGSRVKTKSRLILNLFIVWLLTGIWHGANWTFIVWGIYYFILLSIEKLTDFEKRLNSIGIIKWLYSMLAVMFGWIIFRSKTLAEFFVYFKALFGLNGNALTDKFLPTNLDGYWIFFIAAILLSCPLDIYIGKLKILRSTIIKEPAYVIVMCLLFILSFSYIVKGTYNPFIYFNF